MFKLNKDILYLISKELRDDKRTLYSCLFVNKCLCEIIIAILWKNPWRFLTNGKMEPLFNTIVSHLPDEFIYDLKGHSHRQRPLFDYICYCRNLDLYELTRIVKDCCDETEVPTYLSEILKRFINGSTRFT